MIEVLDLIFTLFVLTPIIILVIFKTDIGLQYRRNRLLKKADKAMRSGRMWLADQYEQQAKNLK